MKTTKERLQEFVKHKGYGRNKFEEQIGISIGYLSSRSISITSDVIEKVAHAFPELDVNWLITGNGEMYKKDTPLFFEEKVNGAIPYYADLPVSAGQAGLSETEKREKPTGYMLIPNISAERLFPVIGYSMLPLIKPGDIIGVNMVNNWDRVEPDKIYLIVTIEERMIKRLRIDNENEEILWCVSENYSEFKIYKNEIVSIFHVVFHGELM